MRGGTPSMMAPTPLQCDSPKVVTRKTLPKELMAATLGHERRACARDELCVSTATRPPHEARRKPELLERIYQASELPSI